MADDVTLGLILDQIKNVANRVESIDLKFERLPCAIHGEKMIEAATLAKGVADKVEVHLSDHKNKLPRTNLFFAIGAAIVAIMLALYNIVKDIIKG